MDHLVVLQIHYLEYQNLGTELLICYASVQTKPLNVKTRSILRKIENQGDRNVNPQNFLTPYASPLAVDYQEH